MGKILRNKIISQLPLGSIFRRLSDNTIYIVVHGNYIQSGFGKIAICLDEEEYISNQAYLASIELLRLGYSNELLYIPERITTHLQYDEHNISPLEIIKAIKELTSLGLKEAKDLVDFSKAHGTAIVLDSTKSLVDEFMDKYGSNESIKLTIL